LAEALSSVTGLDITDFVCEWEKYHTNGDISLFLENVNRKCPDISHVYLLDDNVGGNNLTAINQVCFSHFSSLPHFKYIANMHGNEILGRELLLMLAHDLCTGWRKNDQKITNLIKLTRIHLLPTMNPDGWSKAFHTSKDRETVGRENANKVDLNRNFPNLDAVVFKNVEKNGPFDHLYNYSQEKNKNSNLVDRQPTKETRMIMQWLDRYNFVLSANMHGGDLVANYPYDSSPSGRADIYTDESLHAEKRSHMEFRVGDNRECKLQ
uniref:Carboxypeptidase N catalytic chain n=1 Tax=Echinostoma caproni TaxID=27848 RepID=A0A183B1T7_9TREM